MVATASADARQRVADEHVDDPRAAEAGQQHDDGLGLGDDLADAHGVGADAARIGEIVAEPQAIVVLLTGFGGTRIVDMLVGDPLPRIC